MTNSQNEGNQDAANQENLDETKPLSEDEIRQQIIDETGLDEIDNEEAISKLVKREVKVQSDKFNAIQQKKRQRTEKETYAQRMRDAGLDPETGQPLEKKPKEDPKKEIPEGVMTETRYKEIKFQEQLDDLNIEGIEIDDDFKKEVEKVAKLNNQTPKQAVSDPFIQWKIQEKKNKTAVDDASLGNNPSGRVRKQAGDLERVNLEKEDLSTPEARLKLAEKFDKEANKAWEKNQT